MKITRCSIVCSEQKLDDLFDAKNGYGEISMASDPQYQGFTLYLHPSEFLKLAEKTADKNISFYEMLLDNNEPLFNPHLEIKQSTFAKKPCWKVTGHEGRHRMMAIQKRYGDSALIPVFMIPWFPRNKGLTTELLSLPLVGEAGSINQRKAFIMPTDRIDKNSTKANFGVRSLSKKYPRPFLK